MDEFIQGVKSTIDRYGVNIAQSIGAGIEVVDATSHVNVEELLASDQDLVIWELGTMDEAPRKPFWDISFVIGAKTVKDPSNYQQLDILQAIGTVLEVDTTLPVHNYTGAVAGPQIGYMVVRSVGVDRHQSDRMMGLRMVVVTAKGFSYP